MSDELEIKVAGKEIIDQLEGDILNYSNRNLNPGDIYLLISKTKRYQGIDDRIIQLMMKQILGEKYVTQQDIPKPQENYPQQPEIKNYEPDNTQALPVQEAIQKPKKKRSKVGCIIGLTAFLALASVGGYVGYQKYQEHKIIEQKRQKKLAEEKEREWREKNENERITRDIYLENAVCYSCNGKKEDTCGVCKGEKKYIIGEYVPGRDMMVKCPYCQGAGFHHSRGKCPKCSGSGEIYEYKGAIDGRKEVSCTNCLDEQTHEPTGFKKCTICKGTGIYGEQMARVVYNGFGEAKDTLKKWIEY